MNNATRVLLYHLQTRRYLKPGLDWTHSFAEALDLESIEEAIEFAAVARLQNVVLALSHAGCEPIAFIPISEPQESPWRN